MEGGTIDLSGVIKELATHVPVWTIIISLFGFLCSLIVICTGWIVRTIKNLSKEFDQFKLMVAKNGLEGLPKHVEKFNEFSEKVEDQFREVWKRFDKRRPS